MINRKLSIVIPCYRSENTICQVVDETIAAVEARPEYDFEIILINDGSPDRTWEVISELALEDSRIKAINLSRNFGQHSALMAGYRAVTGDIVVGLDDDGEHDPAGIFRLVDKLDEGFDYVCAHFAQNQPTGFRKLGTAANAKMAEILMDKPKTAELSSFYVERRFVMDYIVSCHNPMPYIAGLLLQATHNMATVDVAKRKRLDGVSGYTLKKLLSLWINGFTAFSVKPLRFVTLLGVGVAMLGFVLAMWLIVRKILYPEILAGYSSIISTVLILGGTMLMALGMVGEYVGRIYLCINQLPQYIIRESINCSKETSEVQ